MESLEPESKRSWQPAVAAGVMLVATVAALRMEGRLWWCACGGLAPWIGNVQSEHCSQHLFDPYALTHVLHGVGFYGALALLLPRVTSAWKFAIVLGLEGAWEVLENSPLVIERYRRHTAALGYEGDSIGNALGDIAACMAGAWFAYRAGWKWGLAFWIGAEVLLLFWIRDNLFLNVFMLLVPAEGLKAWQGGG